MYYHEPLRTKQVHIGTEDKTTLAMIGDYWDDHTVVEIVALLQECTHNTFPHISFITLYIRIILFSYFIPR